MPVLILALSAIALIDLYPLLKAKRWKESVCVGVVFSIGATLSILFSAGVSLRSPLFFLDKFVEEVLHLGYM